MASLPRIDPTPSVDGPVMRPRRLVSPGRFDIEAAIAAIGAGGIAILAEGCAPDAAISVVAAADHILEATVNVMAREARGLICLAVPAAQAERIGLVPMVASPGNSRCLGFARSIEARTGVTTGISAADRARTMAVAANPDSVAADLVGPGHVFPIIAHPDGLIGRLGIAEAAVALAGLAGRSGAAAVCRVLRADGEAATLADLPQLGWSDELTLVSVAMLLDRRCAGEPLVVREGIPRIVGETSDLRIIAYRSTDGGHRHIALVRGAGAERAATTVQICRRAADGQDIEAESTLAAAIGHALAAPGDETLVLIDAGHEGDPIGNAIVVDAIARQILNDIAIHG